MCRGRWRGSKDRIVAHTSDGLKKSEQIPASIPSLGLETLLIDLLNRTGELHHPLLGESMRPTLPSGSLLTVKPLTGGPAVGDILVFVWADQLVAHRLVRVATGVKHTRWIITQGDNCVLPDPVRPPSHIIGRVCSATYGGRVIWSSDDHPYRHWRWILRAYLLAAKRRISRCMSRLMQRSRL